MQPRLMAGGGEENFIKKTIDPLFLENQCFYIITIYLANTNLRSNTSVAFFLGDFWDLWTKGES